MEVSTGPAIGPEAISGAPWGAELIDHHTFTQDSLVSADGSLYAINSSGGVFHYASGSWTVSCSRSPAPTAPTRRW